MCFLPGFCDCGWASFVILLLTLFGTAVGVIGLVLGAMRKGALAAGIGIATVCVGLGVGAVGVGGMLHGRSLVEAATSGASLRPDARDRIRAQGYKEAQVCVTAGAIHGVFLVLFGTAAAGVALARRRKKA